MKLLRPRCLISIFHATAHVPTHTHMQHTTPVVPNGVTSGATSGFKRIQLDPELNERVLKNTPHKTKILLSTSSSLSKLYLPISFDNTNPLNIFSHLGLHHEFILIHDTNKKRTRLEQVTHWNCQKVSVCSCWGVQARGSSIQPQPPQCQAGRYSPWEPPPRY